MKRQLLSLFAAIVLPLALAAQIQTPAPSPLCKMEQMVGLTKVTLEYSRPGVKERVIFAEDGLVPFGKMWRTGANKNTIIGFSDDVKIEGNELKAGEYALFTVPGADLWEVIFYTDTNNWGTPQNWDDSKVAARFKVQPQTSSHHFENMLIGLDNLRDASATLFLAWDKTYLPMKLEVDTDTKVMASIQQVMGGPSRGDYYAAARYYYDSGKDLQQALEWVRKANEIEEKYWQKRLEAEILADMGKYIDAIAAAERSKELAAEAGNEGYVRRNEKSIAEWRAKLKEKATMKKESKSEK